MAEALGLGLQAILSFNVQLMVLVGVLAGVLVSSLPGLSATMAVALLLPFTFGMDPVSALLLLAGIYVGAMFGGAIPAILLSTPGTPAAVSTTFDGYPLAKKGFAGKAIAVACIASVAAGLFGVVVLTLVSPPLAAFALKFSAPEYFAVAVFGLAVISSLAEGSVLKAFASGAVGLLLAVVGMDPMTGASRFTFGLTPLLGGISFLAVMVGTAAVAEVLHQIDSKDEETGATERFSIESMRLTKSDLKQIVKPTIIGSLLGVVVGIMPAAGANIASFVSWAQAKLWSKHPEEFGKGSIEGLAASEAGNNSVVGGDLVPMLTLGVPGDPVTAIMMGALILQGLRPGPMLFMDHPEIVYGLFLGLIISNLWVLPIGLFGARFFAKMTVVPKPVLWPIILVLCMVGAYASEGNMTAVYTLVIFGVIGYVMKKAQFPTAPLILGLLLGPMAEENLRRALLMFDMNPMIFVTRPISLSLLLIGLLTLVWPWVQEWYQRRVAVRSGVPLSK
ncbi:MAG TPA: tripartite tricarboxylate transporter permease [Symbiobacteriaceae bacterium]|nr:tripartite tricarboxylate transporter permease [Symbiobacteriaceae bacterium]